MENTTQPSTKFGAVPMEPYIHILDMTDQEAERQLAVALVTVSKILVNGQEKEGNE